jgi:hypothetical protein
MDIESKEELRRGKEETATRCQSVGMSLLIEARVRRVVFRERLTGWADPTTKTIRVPRPTTRRRLHVLAHEVGHLALGHCGRKPVHREEYEAEQFARDALRRHSVAVPKRSSDCAKEYVAWKIHQALHNRAKRIDRDAYCWCKEKLSCEDQKKVAEVALVDLS